MPSDFQSNALKPDGRSIGFHELRQACEISALREDLERIARDTASLRDGIEDAVEQVRARFAALSTEELADSAKMAPLLEFAVTSLLDIREQARAISTPTGILLDAERPSWTIPDTTPPRPPIQPTPPSPESPLPATGLTAPLPIAPRVPRPAPAPPSVSWLNPAATPSGAEAGGSRAAPPAPGSNSAKPIPPGTVDWLAPSRS